jgi:hypothetical protein
MKSAAVSARSSSSSISFKIASELAASLLLSHGRNHPGLASVNA